MDHQPSTSNPHGSAPSGYGRPAYSQPSPYTPGVATPMSCVSASGGPANGVAVNSVLATAAVPNGGGGGPGGGGGGGGGSRFNGVQTWQQNHFSDSGFQSMTPSQAPSVMSFHGSEMSISSSLADVPLTNVPPHILARIERVRKFFTASDPAKAKEALSELIKLLQDSDEDVVSKSIEMLKNVARSDHWRPVSAVPVIDRSDLVFAVKEVLKRYSNNKYIVRCCFCILFFTHESHIVPLIRQNKEDVLDALINGLRILEQNTFKYALLNLSSMVQNAEIGPSVLQYVRDQRALTFLAPLLSENFADKVLSISTDTIMRICQKDEEQRSFFVVSLEGISKLIKILTERAYPPLIENVIKLLYDIASSDNETPVYSQRIVEAGVLRVLHPFLSNPNPHFLVVTLRLICGLSDIRHSDDISPLLECLVILIGYQDQRVKQLCVEALSNLIANQRQYKEFIVNKNAVNMLVQLMVETQHWPQENKRGIEKTQESALSVLCHLCMNNAEANAIVKYLLQTDLQYILLEKLKELRPGVLKPTLLLLKRLCVNAENVAILQSTCLPYASDWYIPVICNVLRVSFSMVNEVVENVRVYILVRDSLEVLTAFCRDRSLREPVFMSLSDASGAPIVPVQLLATKITVMDPRSVQMASLRLLDELAGCPTAAKYLVTEQVHETMTRLQSENEVIASLAHKVIANATDTLKTPQGMGPVPGYGYGYHPPPVAPYVYPYSDMGPMPPATYPNGPASSRYTGPASVYDESHQPMSIGVPVPSSDGAAHEEMAYMTPMDDAPYPSLPPPATAMYPRPPVPSLTAAHTTAPHPMDTDYMAPQSSPFGYNVASAGLESMNWS